MIDLLRHMVKGMNLKIIRLWLLSILPVILLLTSVPANGQQLPLYSQYMLSGFLVNPAMAGSDGYTSFNLTAREQWLGFTDAPQTRSFSVQSRLLRKSYVIKSRKVSRKRLIPSRKGRVGLGGYFYYDRNGLVERTGIQMTYAYHIFFKDNQLSFGLSGTGFQFKVNEDEIVLHDSGDPLINAGLKNVLYIPDANFGVFLMGNQYHVGVSVNQLFQSYLKLGNRSMSEYRMHRHYFATGGYEFFIGREYSLEPSFLIKATEHKVIQADASFKVFFRDDYWVGTSVRTDGTLIAFAGVRFNQLYFGYAFDYTLSNLRRYSYGSHEVMIALKLGDNARRYKWLNRY